MAGSRLCSIAGCGKRRYAKELCHAHYTRLRRHGCATEGGTAFGDPLRWLHAHVDYRDRDCLPWPFARSQNGYANLAEDGRQRSAAARMCELAHGPRPSPYHQAAHSCGQGHKACMNPAHLRWATSSENHNDKHAHGTMLTGERHPGHVLAAAQVLEIRHSAEPQRDTAKKFGISQSTVSLIRRRKIWAAL